MLNNWIHLIGRRSACNTPAASAQEVGLVSKPPICYYSPL